MSYFQSVINNRPLLLRLVNMQFQIIGKSDVKYQDIENGVKIMDGKKEKVLNWWDVYKFDNEDQYHEWLDWVKHQLADKWDGDKLEETVIYLDLAFGMNYPIKKEGELF